MQLAFQHKVYEAIHEQGKHLDHQCYHLPLMPFYHFKTCTNDISKKAKLMRYIIYLNIKHDCAKHASRKRSIICLSSVVVEILLTNGSIIIALKIINDPSSKKILQLPLDPLKEIKGKISKNIPKIASHPSNAIQHTDKYKFNTQVFLIHQHIPWSSNSFKGKNDNRCFLSRYSCSSSQDNSITTKH